MPSSCFFSELCFFSPVMTCESRRFSLVRTNQYPSSYATFSSPAVMSPGWKIRSLGALRPCIKIRSQVASFRCVCSDLPLNVRLQMRLHRLHQISFDCNAAWGADKHSCRTRPADTRRCASESLKGRLAEQDDLLSFISLNIQSVGKHLRIYLFTFQESKLMHFIYFLFVWMFSFPV